MFASESLAVHLGRGVVGFGATALGVASGNFVILLPLLVVALVALRGCPMCWTMGLVETVINHSRRGNDDVVFCVGCNAVERKQIVNKLH